MAGATTPPAAGIDLTIAIETLVDLVIDSKLPKNQHVKSLQEIDPGTLWPSLKWLLKRP